MGEGRWCTNLGRSKKIRFPQRGNRYLLVQCQFLGGFLLFFTLDSATLVAVLFDFGFWRRWCWRFWFRCTRVRHTFLLLLTEKKPGCTRSPNTPRLSLRPMPRHSVARGQTHGAVCSRQAAHSRWRTGCFYRFLLPVIKTRGRTFPRRGEFNR